MSEGLSNIEGTALHYFMGGMKLDENGATTRKKIDWNDIWTKLDCLHGYTNTRQEVRHDLLFRLSTRRGKCGLNYDGTHILFPLFLLGSLNETGMRDEEVIEVVEFSPPTFLDKNFFSKMSKLVGRTCKDMQTGTVQNPKWLCDWDFYSFRDNILEPKLATHPICDGTQ
jgi:hypothetical protein